MSALHLRRAKHWARRFAYWWDRPAKRTYKTQRSASNKVTNLHLLDEKGFDMLMLTTLRRRYMGRKP